MKDNAMYVSLKKLFEQPSYIECVRIRCFCMFMFKKASNFSLRIKSDLFLRFSSEIFFVEKGQSFHDNPTYISAHILPDNAK